MFTVLSKGNQHETNETIYKNPHGTDHCRYPHRYRSIYQNQFKKWCASDDTIHYLDHFLRNPHWDNHLVCIGL